MKIFSKSIKIVSLLLAVVLLGCEKDLDSPPSTNVLDPGKKLTIGQLRALYQNSEIVFNDDKYFFGVITTDERSGNFYRSHYIQDETGAINIRVDTGIDILEGDSVRVSLNGVKLSEYNKMLQVDGLVYGKNVVRQARGHSIEPALTTIAQIRQGNMQGQLIKLEGVQFLPGELNKTYADPVNQTSQNREITDCDGDRIIVRTSGFANFAGTKVAQGNGRFVGIVSVFGTTWQLLIRNLDELDMIGTRCTPEGTPMGSGTFEDPYNVAHAIGSNTGTNVWVEGFIVGVMETDVDPFTTNFAGPTWRTNSNIIIAEKANETNIDKCVIVQLLAGDIRNALNLVNNPNNKGKKVKLRGNLASYFGKPGLRETSGYWLEGGGIVPQVPFFEQAFVGSLGNFTGHNIIGTQAWVHATFDGGCAAMSGFASGTSHANEDWLVSPAINLAGKTNVKLRLREAINFLTSYNHLQVMVSSNYTSGNPTENGTWAPLTLSGRPPGNNWTFVDTNDINLSAYDGQNIHIAFKYTSTSAGASTWQVSKVSLMAD
jgi:hypothetical protein